MLFHLTASASERNFKEPSHLHSSFMISFRLTFCLLPSLAPFRERFYPLASCYSNRSITWNGLLISEIARPVLPPVRTDKSIRAEESLRNLSHDVTPRNQINVRVDIYFRNYQGIVGSPGFICLLTQTTASGFRLRDHPLLRFLFISKTFSFSPSSFEEKSNFICRDERTYVRTANGFLLHTPLSEITRLST